MEGLGEQWMSHCKSRENLGQTHDRVGKEREGYDQV